MSLLFNRFPPPSRRAIFHARKAALTAGSSEIDATHLLLGLMAEKGFRANSLFKLEERLPDEAARACVSERAADQKQIPLSPDSKRVLAYAEDEANQLDDYWIDTDHLILGILRERTCSAAAQLDAAGLRIEEARKQMQSSSAQRENFGPIPALWRLAKPITRIGHLAGIIYLVVVLVLIELVAGKRC